MWATPKFHLFYDSVAENGAGDTDLARLRLRKLRQYFCGFADPTGLYPIPEPMLRSCDSLQPHPTTPAVRRGVRTGGESIRLPPAGETVRRCFADADCIPFSVCFGGSEQEAERETGCGNSGICGSDGCDDRDFAHGLISCSSLWRCRLTGCWAGPGWCGGHFPIRPTE